MATIEHLSARTILDSRDEWTIEVSATLSDGATATASVPQGKSKGSLEAHYVQAEDAVRSVEDKINQELHGFPVEHQERIDAALIALDGTENKSVLGANAILGVSIALLRACAHSNNRQLYQHIRDVYGFPEIKSNPRLLVNVVNGGLHSGNNLDFQEYLIIPKAESIKDSIDIATSYYHALKAELTDQFGSEAGSLGDEGGFAPDFSDNVAPFSMLAEIASAAPFDGHIDFGLDAAASNIEKNATELMALYEQLHSTTGLWYLEDPFTEQAFDDFRTARERFSPDTYIVGDDLTVTNVFRLEEAHDKGAINGVIIKPNQIGTVTEAIRTIEKAQEYGYGVFVSHRSGETNDDFISDLAYAVNATGIKLGAPARGERVAKYNRLLAIESQEQ